MFGWVLTAIRTAGCGGRCWRSGDPVFLVSGEPHDVLKPGELPHSGGAVARMGKQPVAKDGATATQTFDN